MTRYECHRLWFLNSFPAQKHGGHISTPSSFVHWGSAHLMRTVWARSHAHASHSYCTPGSFTAVHTSACARCRQQREHSLWTSSGMCWTLRWVTVMTSAPDRAVVLCTRAANDGKLGPDGGGEWRSGQAERNRRAGLLTQRTACRVCMCVTAGLGRTKFSSSPSAPVWEMSRPIYSYLFSVPSPAIVFPKIP